MPSNFLKIPNVDIEKTFPLGNCCRKRQRLEEYPESATVNKLTELIGRGKLCISTAAEIAQTAVSWEEVLWCMVLGSS